MKVTVPEVQRHPLELGLEHSSGSQTRLHLLAFHSSAWRRASADRPQRPKRAWSPLSVVFRLILILLFSRILKATPNRLYVKFPLINVLA